MKPIPLFLGAIAIAAATAFAEGDIDLRVSPERDKVFRTDNAEAILDISLIGRDVISERKCPLNLALVIDHSGSMSEDHKIEHAREAARIAIDHLQPTDTFSLVEFDDRVKVLVPAQPVGDKDELKQIVNRIEPGGSTALYSGVQEGAHQLRKYFDEKNVNRIVLVSDGIANVGPSSPSEMVSLGRSIRNNGGSVSTVGLGLDYNEDVMASIAEASGANYYYVRDAEKLPDVIAQELGQVKDVLAQNLHIIIEVPEGVDPIEVVGMPEVKFEGRKATVTLGAFYGSQHRDILVRCKIKSPQGDSAELAHAQIVYNAAGSGKELQADGVAHVHFTAQQADSDKSVNKSVAAEFALTRNAVTRKAALEMQDRGKFKEAAHLLKAQAQADAAAAPALGNAKLAEEAKSLGGMADQLDSEKAMSNGQRKDFQYENYNQANQKAQQQ